MRGQKRHIQRWLWLLGALAATWLLLVWPASARPLDAVQEKSGCMVSARGHESPVSHTPQDIDRVDARSLVALPVVRVNLPATLTPVSVPVLVANLFRLLQFRQPVRTPRLFALMICIHQILAHHIAINAP